MSVIFLKPQFKYRIWGGNKLKEDYYSIAPDKTGEAWLISGHQNGSTEIINGQYRGSLLKDFYLTNPNLFNDENKDQFPLLVKLIDAADNLSVQVHPDDKMALEYHSLGKTECWYIISATDEAEIIYGHNALTKEDFITKVKNKDWENLLRRRKVKSGDFYELPAVMVNAINKGVVILEVQQSADLTFRLYDYERIDKDGKKRELHLAEAIAATTFPQQEYHFQKASKKINSNLITTLTDAKYFKVEKWDLKEQIKTENNHYTLMVFLEGSGTINNEYYQKGDACIVLSDAKEIEIIPEEKTLLISANSK